LFGDQKKTVWTRSLQIIAFAALFLCASLPHTAKAQDITTGLIGYWNFDETTGTTASNLIGSASDGTVTGTDFDTGKEAGKFNNALGFDGVDDTVNLGSSLSIVNDFTICAWVKPAGTTTGYIFGKTHSGSGNPGPYMRQFNTGNEWGMGMGSAIMSDNSVDVGVWQHLCAVYTPTPGLSKLYKNGAMVNSRTFNAFSPNTIDATIGNNLLNNRQFEGAIDEVRIYNRALTDGDVTKLYNYTPYLPPCNTDADSDGNPDYEAVMLYNNDEKVMQYCDGTEWVSVGSGSDGMPTGCSNIGDTCGDGSIYAGLSPDGNVPMYTTPADAPGKYTWNDGSANTYDTMINCTSSSSPGSTSSCQTGEQNTQTLSGLSGSGTPAPYAAAQYCADLAPPNAAALGHDDWYLPAMDELNLLNMYKNTGDLNGTFIETGTTDHYYWSSSERGNSTARGQRFNGAYQFYGDKDLSYNVRCVRKPVKSTTCSSPDADPGTMIYNYNEGVLQYCNGEDWISMGPKTAQSGQSADVLSPAAPSSGLIGYWPLDGDATDSAGSNDGTLNNAPTWDSGGKIGGGIQLDGVDQYISTPSISASNPATITVAAWFKADTWGDEDSGCIICINNGGGSDNIQIRLLNDSGQQGLRTFFRGSGDGGQANVHNAVTLGQWHHVAVTYDAGGTRIPLMYIDGLPVSTYDLTGAATGGHGFTTLNAHIGADAVPNRFFDGIIDDARVYNRVLTDDEVLALYKSNSLAGHWKLDETTGTTAADSSGNGNDGTVNGTDFDTSAATGRSGGALTFDGSDDYIDCGTDSSLDITDAITVSAWAYTDTDTHGRIISRHGNSSNFGWVLIRDKDSDSFAWDISTNGNDWNNGGSTGVDTFEINTWYHVAATYDGTNMRVYIDGVEETSGAFPAALSGPINVSSHNCEIGSDGFSSIHFSGQIDDVRIYNRALSSDEIADLYVATGGSGSQPVTGCSAIGDTCDDGTIYAGLSPDGNVPMYTTPADAPGGIAYAWNDGTTNWADTTMTNCTIGSPGPQASCQTGQANTDLLVGLNGSGTPAPYTAAEYCAGLAPPDAAALGHSDWYVPAQDELNVLYENLVDQDGDNTPGGPLGSTFGFNTSNTYAGSYYMSSSENSNAHAISQRFGDGNQQTATKSNDIALRCVRKGDKILISTCSSPYGEPGQIFYNDDENLMQYCNGESWIALAPPTGNATVVPGPDTTDPVWTTAAGTVDTINTGDSLSVTVTATDNSGTVTYSKTGGDAWISVNATTGELTGTAPGSAGTYSITVTATDPSGNTAARSFDVVVADCTSGAIGTVCADGAVYAGTTVGGARMYVADADESGTYAYGGHLTDLNGDNNTVVPELTDDGLANTDWLLSSGAGDHDAAQACRDKGASWYLPAIDELSDINANRAQLGAANLPAGTVIYISSTENSPMTARVQFSNDDSMNVNNGGKNFAFNVRCIRR